MSYRDFRVAYIEALLWSETDCRGDGDCSCHDCGNFDAWADESNFAAGELDKIDADCRAFYDVHGDSFEGATTEHTQDEQAGHDFCMTRNGHGCGFWDGDWPEPLATTLTNACRAFPEVTLHTCDEEVYMA